MTDRPPHKRRGGKPKKQYKAPHQYSEDIAKSVKEQVRAGVAISVIADAFGMSDKTLYKYYGGAIAAARAEAHTAVGTKIYDKAVNEGSDRLLELYARSKMGWTPKEHVEVNESPDTTDESTTAIDELAALLGIDEGDEPEEGDSEEEPENKE